MVEVCVTIAGVTVCVTVAEAVMGPAVTPMQEHADE
jgi:hypothetical protein